MFKLKILILNNKKTMRFPLLVDLLFSICLVFFATQCSVGDVVRRNAENGQVLDSENILWSQLPSDLLSQEIAYISTQTGTAEIWLLDFDTGRETQLTKSSCSDNLPSGTGIYPLGVQQFLWSPDGQRIAYLTFCGDPLDQAQFSIIDVGSLGKPLFTEQVDRWTDFSWSPTGEQVIFTLSSYSSVPGMYRITLDGTTTSKEKLVAGTIGEDCEEICANIAWSPTGGYTAYQGPYVGPSYGSRTYISIVDYDGIHITYDPDWEVFTMDNGNIERYRPSWVHEPSPGGLVWSNNGQYLAIATTTGRTDAHLVLVEVRNQIATIKATMTEDSVWLQEHSADSTIKKFGFYQPQFSPDNTMLYFVFNWLDDNNTPLSYLGTIYSVQVEDLLDHNTSYRLQKVSPEGQLASFPALSPVGSWLVYMVKGNATSEIWLLATDSSHRLELVNNGFVNTQPAWRP